MYMIPQLSLLWDLGVSRSVTFMCGVLSFNYDEDVCWLQTGEFVTDLLNVQGLHQDIQFSQLQTKSQFNEGITLQYGVTYATIKWLNKLCNLFNLCSLCIVCDILMRALYPPSLTDPLSYVVQCQRTTTTWPNKETRWLQGSGAPMGRRIGS